MNEGAGASGTSEAGSPVVSTRPPMPQDDGESRACDKHDNGSAARLDRPPPEAMMPSSVIHELRTPLTAIHGYAQVLQRSLSADPSKARATTVLLAESTRLAALLNQLSELAALDAAGSERSLEDIDVEAVVQDLVAEQEQHSDLHTFELTGQGSVRADRHRLRQVLAHVLDNATAYSPDGGSIRIDVSEGADGLHVAITDLGIGISDEDAERVYECYVRGANARRIGVRGLGLGLYVASQILKQDGGRIWHESATERGTTFHVVLPSR